MDRGKEVRGAPSVKEDEEIPDRLRDLRLRSITLVDSVGTGSITVIEPILLGIVLGLVVVTLVGLFVAAYRQYQRSNTFGL